MIAFTTAVAETLNAQGLADSHVAALRAHVERRRGYGAGAADKEASR